MGIDMDGPIHTQANENENENESDRDERKVPAPGYMRVTKFTQINSKSALEYLFLVPHVPTHPPDFDLTSPSPGLGP